MMDHVLANTLIANLKSAKTDKDLQKAHTLAMIAVVECQCKTGMRVKRQGLILAGIGLLLLVALLCGETQALKLLCFWRSGGAA